MVHVLIMIINKICNAQALREVEKKNRRIAVVPRKDELYNHYMYFYLIYLIPIFAVNIILIKLIKLFMFLYFN